jgi:threonine dehydratase
MLVEPAGGAALALLYSPRHREKLMALGPVVVVVCGGSGINLEILKAMEGQLGLSKAS